MNVSRSRNMAAANLLARLGLLAAKAAGRARIGDHRATADRLAHFALVAHHHRPELGGEMALLRLPGRAVLDGAAFRFPLGKSAVENGNVVMAENAEHPPDAGRREEALGIVADHLLAIADAHLAHP